ncbi:MAG TPA: zf-HC2 domain-containing protein [Vicinamibacterales bacterium]
MCEKELLVGYLYDDLADGDRATFEAHLRGCAECRDELKELRAVRADLASWSPPQPDFGFRVVRGGRDAAATDVREVMPTPVQSWRAWWTPAAGLAAAAVLVLAAAASLAHVEVHRGPDGITVRTGWSAFASAAPSAAGGSLGGTSPASDTGRDIRLASTSDAEFLAGIERRLDALEASSRDSGLRNASMLSARASDAEIIKRVRDLVAQSETKQQGELALRISQVLHDVDVQRANDLARIQQGFGRIDQSVATEAAAHRDLTNYILANAKQK